MLFLSRMVIAQVVGTVDVDEEVGVVLMLRTVIHGCCSRDCPNHKAIVMLLL